MSTFVILDVLERFSKTKVPEAVANLIKDCTMSYGKVKLVLKQNRYYVESGYPEILRLLLNDKVIKDARLLREEDVQKPLELFVKTEEDFGAIIDLDQDDDDVEQRMGQDEFE
jgi:DNA excision repair protein ERCC-3